MGAEKSVILVFLTYPCLQHNLIFAVFVLYFPELFYSLCCNFVFCLLFSISRELDRGKKREIIYSEPRKKDFTGKNKASHTMFPTQTHIISIALISVSCI